MKPRFRRRAGALTVAVVLGVAGSAVLPATDAQARHCPAPSNGCSSETLYTFSGKTFNVNYTITSSQQHWIRTFVNNVQQCSWADTGHNRTWACYRMPAGPAYAYIGNPSGFYPGAITVNVYETEY